MQRRGMPAVTMSQTVVRSRLRMSSAAVESRYHKNHAMVLKRGAVSRPIMRMFRARQLLSRRLEVGIASNGIWRHMPRVSNPQRRRAANWWVVNARHAEEWLFHGASAWRREQAARHARRGVWQVKRPSACQRRRSLTPTLYTCQREIYGRCGMRTVLAPLPIPPSIGSCLSSQYADISPSRL